MIQILAIVVPAGAALIGVYLHRRNEQRKFRLNAYPKRIAIFGCTEEFLGRALTGNYSHWPTLLGAFHNCTREARFLFDKQMADYLDSLYKGAERHFYLETELEIKGDSLEFAEKQALQREAFGSRDWLGQQNRHLKERFAKYLDLGGPQ